MRARSHATVAVPLVVALSAGCGSVVEQPGTGGGGVTTSTTMQTTGGAGGTGGAGAAGGAGGCVPGTLIECYSGPPGTQDVGVCHAGAKECNSDGLTFGPCQWEVTPKPEDCTTPEDEDCNGATPECPGKAVWSEALGGAGDQFAESVAVDAQGNIVVIGGFTGAFTLGAATLTSVGQTDVFVAKLDPSGNVIWAKSFGSTNDDYAVDVAIDPLGNILVTGAVAGNVDLGDGPLAGFGQEDIFLIKLDPTGALVWRKMFGSAESDIGYGVAADAAGNVYTTGEFGGTIDFGTGSLTATAGDAYVAKYAPDGAPIWVKRFGAAYEDFGSGVAVDPMGNLLVTGGFRGPVDFGTGTLTTTGYYDGFVIKIDPAGKTLWATQMKGGIGMGFFPVAFTIAADAHGAAVVGGYFFGSVDLGGGVLTSAGGSDAFVARYDANGNHVFSLRWGGSYVYPQQPTYPTDVAYSVAIEGMDDVLVTGTYTDAPDLGGGPLPASSYGDAFVAKFDATGKHVWSKGTGSFASYSAGSGVAVSPSGDTVISGYFTGTIDLGAGPLSTTTGQETDAFVATLAP